MAELSLRAYLEYIDDRLRRDAFGEVVSQCRHVLDTYPKHIETYKRLAQALAGQNNYTDALDLFQRVLSADPTDFVAHVGMSECYKEDGALDQAIWHLERAFEQAPSNAELQDALKQLYQQRDQKTVRKIQMTSGALARMYIKGKLYPQAISELTKAIARDPERLDLQVLMAEALWYSHQLVASGKVAAEILKKLPYSIVANRVLAQLWLHAGQPKEARPFLERVKELDPYQGYEIEHNGQAAPADAFRLVMVDVAPTRATGRLGVAGWVAEIDSIEKKKSVTGPFKADEPAGEAGAPGATPGWLQEALKASGPLGGQPSATPPPLEVEPDWLRDALAGTGASATPPAASADEDAPDWLKEALGGQGAPAGEPPSSPPAPVPAPAPAPAEGAPEWLKDVLGQETPVVQPPPAAPPPPAPAEGAPGWLKDMLVQETPVQPAPPPAPPAPMPAPAPVEGAPEWLADVLSEQTPPALRPVPAEGGQPVGGERPAPEWLKDIISGEAPPPPAAPPPEPAAPPVVSEEWLDQFITGGPSPVEGVPSTPPTVPLDSGEPVDLDKLGELEAWDAGEPISPPPEDWLTQDTGLESPAAKEPEKESEAIPDWLATGAPAAETSAPKPEAKEAEPEKELPDWLATGAPAAEVSVPGPEAEKAEPEKELPDWLAPRAASAESGPAAEETGKPEAEAAPGEELPGWLKEEPVSAGEGAAALEEEKPVASSDDEVQGGETSEEIPDWLASGDLDSDEAVKWLEELAAKVDPNFKATTAGEAAPAEPAPVEAAPEPVKAEVEVPEAAKVEEAAPAEPEAAKVEELPDWLKGEAPLEPAKAEVTELPVAPAEPEAAKAEELPDWLKGEAPPEPAKAEVAELPVAPEKAAEKEEELPDWLKEEAPAAKAGEELEWLRPPAEAVEPEKAEEEKEKEEEELPEWLHAEEKEAPEAAAPEAADALVWLDQQVAEQGVSSDKVVSEALTPDHPPVAAPPPVPDLEAEAAPASTDELPDWLKEAGAKEEISKALEAPTVEPELAELPEMPVEAEEIAWLDQALKAEEVAAGGDLEELMAAAKEQPLPVAEAAEKKEEALPDWLAEPEAPAEAKEAEGLPEWLTAPEPAAAPAPAAEVKEKEEEKPPEPLPTPEPAAPPAPAAEAKKEVEEELPEWLTKPEPEEASLDEFLKAVEPAALPVQEVPTTPPPAPPAPVAAAPTPAPAPAQPPAAPPPVPVGDAAAQLKAARDQLAAGELQAALVAYEALVGSGQGLEETIADLSEIVKTRVVVNPRVYRVMGDAMMAQGKAQEALEMYRKALDSF